MLDWKLVGGFVYSFVSLLGLAVVGITQTEAPVVAVVAFLVVTVASAALYAIFYRDSRWLVVLGTLAWFLAVPLLFPEWPPYVTDALLCSTQ